MPAPDQVIERILQQHGVPRLAKAIKQGDRPKANIDAIIHDVKAANAEAGR